MSKKVRVAVWSTGGIGSIVIRALAGRPDLELVGVWVHSPDKVGKDSGLLAGGEANGVAAEGNMDALIAKRPDCVVYAASGPERDTAAVIDYCRFLEAGINVVTTTSSRFIHPESIPSPWQEQLAEAALKGKASFHAAGVFPGFGSDHLVAFLSTLSASIDRITIYEICNYHHYPVASLMRDAMGFGMPPDYEPMLAKPGYIEAAWGAPLRYVAAALGEELTEIRSTYERVLADRTLDVAFGRIEPGTCGATRTRAIGMVRGKEAIVLEHVTRMAQDIAPEWPAMEHDAIYAVSIEGEPDIDCRITLGQSTSTGAGEAGMTGTAMRALNAVPYLVDAAPGLLSSLDLPLTLPRHALKG